MIKLKYLNNKKHPSILIIGAQVLFMIIPIIDIFLRRHVVDKDRIFLNNLTSLIAANIAFALLFCLFTIQKKIILMVLSGTNLILRIVELVVFLRKH